jgi:transcriptional regulator with XRE-family HTH domain
MSFTLKRLRHEAGLTLEALAQASGLTRSYVSKIERGLSAPSVGVALKLAQALDVPVERLFGASSAAEAVSISRIPDGPSSHGPRVVAGASGRRRMTAFVLSPGQHQSRKPRMNDHEGEEILFVLKGEISLHLAGRTEHLRAGDCAQFDASIPHRVEQVGSSEAEVLLVITGQADRT